MGCKSSELIAPGLRQGKEGPFGASGRSQVCLRGSRVPGPRADTGPGDCVWGANCCCRWAWSTPCTPRRKAPLASEPRLHFRSPTSLSRGSRTPSQQALLPGAPRRGGLTWRSCLAGPVGLSQGSGGRWPVGGGHALLLCPQMLSCLEHMYHDLGLVRDFSINPITLKRWLVSGPPAPPEHASVSHTEVATWAPP